jgi:large subunit ribosomal protein L31
MKKNVHPEWYPQAKVTCVCGASFTTGSTKPEIHVDICSQCHPFFTGEMKFVDTQGRIEKFKAKQDAAKGYTKKRKNFEEKDESPKTLKEMLHKK